MDRFSTPLHTSLYAKYRTEAPEIIIDLVKEYLLEKIPKNDWKTMVDVGCGTGQSTRAWSGSFQTVYGFDVSPTQIEEAKRQTNADNITFQLASAEKIPLPDNSVQLVTVSQAIHWFDKEAFFKEVQRILVPNGAFAVFRYLDLEPYLASDTEKVDKRLKELYTSQYFRPELYKQIDRKVFEDRRKELTDFEIPLRDRRRGKEGLVNVVRTNCEFVICHITTWSMFQKCNEQNETLANEILEQIRNEMRSICNESDLSKTEIDLHYQYVCEMGRK